MGTFIRKIQAWFARQAVAVRLAVDGGIGATVIGCWVGVWLSPGDPVIIWPVLIFGTLVGFLGIGTSERLSKHWKVGWAIVLSVVSLGNGGFVYWHTHQGADNALMMTWDMPHRTQIGTDQIDLTFYFHNAAKSQAIIRDLGIVELYSMRPRDEHDFQSEGALCTDIPIGFMGRASVPEYHNEGGVSAEFKGRKYDYFVYHPKPLTLNGSPTQPSSMYVPAESMGIVVATFKPKPINKIPRRTILICPFVRSYDFDDKPMSIICPAFGRDVDVDGGEDFSRHDPALIVPLGEPSPFCSRPSGP